MRTYTTHEGQLVNLHKRFRDHTNRIFEKHGVSHGILDIVGGDLEKNTFAYILAYPSREARDKAWSAFVKTLNGRRSTRSLTMMRVVRS